MMGLFGGMFDLDRDGNLDSFEQAMEFQVLDEMERGERAEDEWEEE